MEEHVEEEYVEEEYGESMYFSVLIEYQGSSLGHSEGAEQVGREETITADTQLTDWSDGFTEELLPGMPDQITLGQIIPKLPWKAFHILSSVSRCWREAIQAHETYDSRVRSKSTESLIVHIHCHGETEALALYSLKDKCCHELPPISQLENRIPLLCQCIALDGKIYVLGGEDPECGFRSIAEVFVLDLAGQRKWRRCASMQEPRQEFGCGVFDGKIFVFGGSSDNQGVLGSEVYDPKQDVWSSRTPMPSWRCEHHVATVGNELFVYGGRFKSWGDQFFCDASLLDIYHPAKDEWRLIDPFGVRGMPWGSLAMANGILYLMSGGKISVYDSEKDEWTEQRTSFFPQDQPLEPLNVVPTATLAVDDEVVVSAHWFNTDSAEHGTYLFHSKGFASEKTELEWQTISCPFPITLCSCEALSSGLKCTIRI